MVWPRKEARPRLRPERLWRWYHLGKEKVNTEAEMDGLCQPRHDSHRNDERWKSMIELAGGELCLLQRPHNQVVPEQIYFGSLFRNSNVNSGLIRYGAIDRLYRQAVNLNSPNRLVMV